MVKERKDYEKIGKFLYFAPRILSIIFILFLFMFSFDVFDSDNVLDIIIAFFLHNIPVFILTVILILSWKREIIASVAFFLAGLLYLFLNLFNIIKNGFEWYYLAWIIQISGFAFIISVLFFLNWRRRK